MKIIFLFLVISIVGCAPVEQATDHVIVSKDIKVIIHVVGEQANENLVLGVFSGCVIKNVQVHYAGMRTVLEITIQEADDAEMERVEERMRMLNGIVRVEFIR